VLKNPSTLDQVESYTICGLILFESDTWFIENTFISSKRKRSTNLENLPLFFLNPLLLHMDIYIGTVGIGKELKTINRQF